MDDARPPHPFHRYGRCGAMLLGSLFSGYGGLDLAVADVFDVDTAWHAEIETAAVRVLRRHWPDAANLGDIGAVDWSAVPGVDILAGGFPCQDVSFGGGITNGRAGITEKSRSGLWTEFARAIGALRPQLVIVENVRGLYTAPATVRALGPVRRVDGLRPLRAIEAVLGDLADLGYDARWTSVRASTVGAPHQRARVFIAAWPATSHPDRLELRRQRTHRSVASSAGTTRQAVQPDPVDRRAAAARVLDPRWQQYAPTIARWEAILGRPAPHPVAVNGRGNGCLDPRFAEWMMGLPAGWVTDTPGLTSGHMRRMLGNGVVPQQAALAIRHLLDLDAAPR
ncbi:DNA cytosine methyltransferase [Actinoplanes sp. NPDC049668]|uniref:DNA cytosine methyltransferase n=1 Tax=unclassified Actinoplanes TaxID=2626549 RepID=UPI0033BCA591